MDRRVKTGMHGEQRERGRIGKEPRVGNRARVAVSTALLYVNVLNLCANWRRLKCVSKRLYLQYYTCAPLSKQVLVPPSVKLHQCSQMLVWSVKTTYIFLIKNITASSFL